MSANAPRENVSAVAFLDGIGPLIERYDGFLLDQWGVLHDGANAYPGARECLARLRDAGKAIAIVSNSGRRDSENETLLARMGFPRALYDGVISAGDDARDAILNDPDPFYRTLGKRCFVLARENEDGLVDGLGVTQTERIADADFLFALSMDSPRQSVAGWQPILEAAVARDLPMVCGNPDIWRVHADGQLYEAPGLLGRAYAARGGRVRYHGKPEPRIYRTSLACLGLSADRVLAVGDSLEHDVAGAVGSGIDAAFILGGIHRHDVAWRSSNEFNQADCLRLIENAASRPLYVMSHFTF
ncbi:MAG: TIGR01459 family HAD-type hydrolase [Variibacter sp.]